MLNHREEERKNNMISTGPQWVEEKEWNPFTSDLSDGLLSFGPCVTHARTHARTRIRTSYMYALTQLFRIRLSILLSCKNFPPSQFVFS